MITECSCTRRTVLAGGLLAAGTTVVSTALGGRAYGATPAANVLVVVSLRGGADGLSLVPPVGDANYYTHRPTLAVPKSAAIQLDSTFALHPALSALKPLWDKGSLAVVHATGSPNPSRSHFDAQRELERAAFDASTEPTGWLDRYLASLPAGQPTFTAIERGDLLPGSLAGSSAVALSSLESFSLDVWSGDQPKYNNALAALYAGLSHPMGPAAGTTLSALSTAGGVNKAAYTPANGATYAADDTAQSLMDVARLIKANIGLRVATVNMQDWDMHDGLGTVDGGWMHDHATILGNALAAFATDLGAALGNVTVVTVSEFGRRVQENDSGGVDHGHGMPMFVLGGGVKGGKVYGKWPTLADAALDNGDLAATTDYRNVFGDVLAGKMGASAATLGSVFPGWSRSSLGLFAS